MLRTYVPSSSSSPKEKVRSIGSSAAETRQDGRAISTLSVRRQTDLCVLKEDDVRVDVLVDVRRLVCRTAYRNMMVPVLIVACGVEELYWR
jgi:hypothetical protein